MDALKKYLFIIYISNLSERFNLTKSSLAIYKKKSAEERSHKFKN